MHSEETQVESGSNGSNESAKLGRINEAENSGDEYSSRHFASSKQAEEQAMRLYQSAPAQQEG